MREQLQLRCPFLPSLSVGGEKVDVDARLSVQLRLAAPHTTVFVVVGFGFRLLPFFRRSCHIRCTPYRRHCSVPLPAGARRHRLPRRRIRAQTLNNSGTQLTLFFITFIYYLRYYYYYFTSINNLLLHY